MTNSILTAREERSKLISKLTKSSSIITIRANIPGENKNNPFANLLVAYASKKMEKVGATKLNAIDSPDGRTVFAEIDDGVVFKKKAVDFEEKEELGRLSDIDVFNKGENKSISRGSLRTCYLCNKPAVVCARVKNHTQKELVEYFCQKVKNTIEKEIQLIVKQSMMDELNLTQKFGLVSKTENGSHCDLNYEIMNKAITGIYKDIAKCFMTGLLSKSTDCLFDKLQVIGLKAEKEMYIVTSGANAYKGFIFIGSILMASCGYAISNRIKSCELFNIAKEILKDFNKTAPTDTFGAKANVKGFGGIRKEANSGFAIIKQAEALFEEPKDNSLLFALSRIVGLIEDSVLLKRAGSREKYDYFKEQISTVDVFDEKAVRELNKKCVENNISVGGSADILIATIMIKRIKAMLFF